MLHKSLNQAQRKLHTIENRMEAAQQWNKENKNIWSIKFSSKGFQAQMLITTDWSDFNFPKSIPPTNDPTGPVFPTVDEAKMFILDEIEKSIDSTWEGKMKWDFDLC